MTTDISPEGLMAVYQALQWAPTGKVAVKITTGELPASNYLPPGLTSDVVKLVDGTKATVPYFLVGIILSAIFQRYVPEQMVVRMFGSHQGFGV